MEDERGEVPEGGEKEKGMIERLECREL